jgi:diguanylate cyclase (GGDEF)-like protein
MTHDELTGLQTNVAFEGALKEALAASDGVALALIDVDNFKEINDSQGYEAGDTILRLVASQIAEAAPEHAYRLGGDEFALILPDTTLEQAFLRMEALRARVQEAVRARFNRHDAPATIKVGVAHHPRDAKDERGLLSAAGTRCCALPRALAAAPSRPPTAARARPWRRAGGAPRRP